MSRQQDADGGRIGEMLIGAGIITADQLALALDFQTAEGGRLGSALVKLGAIDEDVLSNFLAMQKGTEAITLSKQDVAVDVLALVPAETAYRHGVIPLNRNGDELTVVMVDPEDREALSALRRGTGLRIRPQIAPQTSVYSALKRLYSGGLAGSSAPAVWKDDEAKEWLRRRLLDARRILDEVERELLG